MSDTDREPLSQLTQLLNEAFSIGAEISGDGALHLRMDDDLGVSVAPTPDREDIVFCAILADLTRGRTVATMAAAMSLNLYQEGTRGGALALDMGTQTVVLGCDCLNRFSVSIPSNSGISTSRRTRSGFEDSINCRA